MFICVTPYFIAKRQIPDVESHLRIWVPAMGVAMCGFSLFMFIAVRYFQFIIMLKFQYVPPVPNMRESVLYSPE